LIGAGVGITPLRALFEALPARRGEMTLIYRVRSVEDLAFRGEIDAIAAAKHATVHYLVGSRAAHPEYLTARHLAGLVPDVARREVYVCGPPELITATIAALRTIGVPVNHIHSEHFEL
jgi:ferredoxin-NADP reductase